MAGSISASAKATAPTNSPDSACRWNRPTRGSTRRSTSSSKRGLPTSRCLTAAYWQFNDIVIEPPTAQKPHPPIWMGAGGERSIRRVAEEGYNLLLGQYASPKDVAHSIAVFRDAVEANGRRFDPMQVGVTRAFFVTDNKAEKEAALKRRLQNRMRQLKLATRPDGTVHGGPDRATGDPRAVNVNSAMYGTPDEIADRLEQLRDAGVGYILINGGGSGGGARGRGSLRRFAREVMPSFAGGPTGLALAGK